ncbi:MAG: methyltransferase domain-containing protein [FCB group bacterium]|nr:methyltransferase domain-containing protein [FCB group bacterium]
MRTLRRELDTKKTQQSYSRIAPLYDLWSKVTESKAARLVLELAEIKNRQEILEIACGTGIVLEQIILKNTDGRNVGLDLSPHMLNKARKRLAKYAASHYELIESDMFSNTFPDESFDLLINNFMIDLLPVELFDRVAEEFHRLLKPGGSLVIATFADGPKFYHRFWRWVAEKLPGLLTGCRPVEISEPLLKAGFKIEKQIQLSQNTFPSEVIKARKAS